MLLFLGPKSGTKRGLTVLFNDETEKSQTKDINNYMFFLQVIETKRAIARMTETHLQNDKDKMSKERKLTLMVITVVSVFLLCNITDLIWWIWKTVAGNEPPEILLCVSVFTEMLHSCVNVIIYASFGKFKQQFYELFCKPCLRRDIETRTELQRLKSNLTTKASLLSFKTQDSRHSEPEIC